MSKKIYIYDTTLRDGAQAEGISFSLAGKLQVAKRLDAMFDWGAGEVLVSVVPAGPDKEASRERTLRFLAEMAKED